jgi:hypothetical protein
MRRVVDVGSAMILLAFLACIWMSASAYYRAIYGRRVGERRGIGSVS